MKSLLAAAVAAACAYACAAPAEAQGQHLECAMNFSASQFNETPADTHRTLGFYLDDAAKKIVADSPSLSLETTSYSDSQVQANVSDPPPKNGVSLFGYLIDGKTQILIVRKPASAILFGSLLPSGAIVGKGDCQQVDSPPATP